MICLEQHNWRHWGLIGLAFLAFALRLYRLQFQSLWRDEVDTILFATREWPALLSTFGAPGENGPLYFLSLRPWVALLGTSEFAVRYSSVFFGVMAVLLTYQVGRQLLPPDVSFVGSLLTCLSPYLVWYSQEAKMYALLVCFSALSTWYLLKGSQAGGLKNWAGYVAVTSLGFYVHLLAVLLLPFHVLLFILRWPFSRKQWREGLVSLACLTLPYMPLLRWEIPTLLSSFQTGHPFYPLTDILRILLQRLSFGVREPTFLEMGFMVFLLLLGSFLYRRTGALSSGIEAFPQGALWLYALVPVVCVYLISLGMPIFADRYLITIAPAFYLLLACGLSVLRARSSFLLGLCLMAVLVSDVRGLWLQSHMIIKADFRGAANYYSEHASADDLLIFQMPYVRRNFDYYYHKPYFSANGLYTNRGMKWEKVESRMRDLTQGYVTVWLLQSEAAMWDERGLVEKWLQTHAQLTQRAEFQLVSLSRYALAP